MYLAAVVGYLPSKMIRCLSTFINACYIVRRNAISEPVRQRFKNLVEQFQQLRSIFIESGVRASISLPRQHALPHFVNAIELFGAPNGLCSSITESKHIKAVKEPWRRSSRFRALVQMLIIIIRMEKMAALRQRLKRQGFLKGTTADAYLEGGQDTTNQDSDTESDDEDCIAIRGNVEESFTHIRMAARIR